MEPDNLHDEITRMVLTGAASQEIEEPEELTTAEDFRTLEYTQA